MPKRTKKTQASDAATCKGRRAARAYRAKDSQLAELSLIECYLHEHALEIRVRSLYVENIAKSVARLRDEIKATLRCSK